MSNRVKLIKGNEVSLIDGNKVSLIKSNKMSIRETFVSYEGAPFDPLSLNPALWLDASDTDTITDVAGLVTQWDDKSVNDYHVTQPTAIWQPTTNADTINGKNVMTWPDSDNFRRMTKDGDGTQNWQDVYVVCRYTGPSTFDRYLGLFTGYNNSGSGSGVGVVGWQNKQTLYTSQKWWDNVYINGSEILSPYTVLPAISSTHLIRISADSAIAVDGVTIGGDRNGFTRSWYGVIAEVLAFNSKLSSGDSSSLKSYLDDKWAL